MADLYILTYENDHGDNMYLLITADSPDQAVLMYRAEWADYLDPDQFIGKITTGPVPENLFNEPLRIFLVQPDPHCAGVLSWHKKQPHHHGLVSLVGWLI